MVDLTEEWKEDLNAADGVQRRVDRVRDDRSHIAEHLCVRGVNEMRHVALRAGLQHELLFASDRVVVEDDGAHQLAVVHGLALRLGEHVRTLVLELELILVGRTEFVQALDDHGVQVRAEQVERRQLPGETRQIVAFGRAADVALVEDIAALDAPRIERAGDQLPVDVAVNAALAPALVLMREGDHVPLRKSRPRLGERGRCRWGKGDAPRVV